MKRKIIVLLAAVMLIGALILPASAYFTATMKAQGSVPLTFGTETEIEEEVKDFEKSVRIRNTGGAHPELAEAVWVRARAYAGTTYTLTVTGWGEPDENGWYYFSKPVQVGDATDPLKVQIAGVPAKDDADHPFSEFNVAVVYETSPARYNEDGSIKEADWKAVLDSDLLQPGESN